MRFIPLSIGELGKYIKVRPLKGLYVTTQRIHPYGSISVPSLASSTSLLTASS